VRAKSRGDFHLKRGAFFCRALICGGVKIRRTKCMAMCLQVLRPNSSDDDKLKEMQKTCVLKVFHKSGSVIGLRGDGRGRQFRCILMSAIARSDVFFCSFKSRL